MGALAGDVDYRERFSSAFRRRRLHPSTEMRVWDYVVGKPAERVQLSADITMNQKLDQERELFRQLPIEQLEILAAESQALVNKAMMMVKENALTSGGGTAPRAPVEDSGSNDTNGSKHLSADVARFDDRALPVCVSPSPAAAGDDVVTGEPAEGPTAGGTHVDVRSGKL